MELDKRVLEISYKYGLSHLGSCLTAVNIIDDIFKIKKKDEPFILSCGHAGLALYCVIEKYEGIDAEKIFKHHGVHPDYCPSCHLECSTGSLGMGLSIATGMALADRKKKVYCLVSDGECAEGVVWEIMRIIKENRLWNLRLYFNINGWGAYKKIELEDLANRLDTWMTYKEVKINLSDPLTFLKGLDAHYHVMTKEEYETAIR
jgi:transketolase